MEKMGRDGEAAVLILPSSEMKRQECYSALALPCADPSTRNKQNHWKERDEKNKGNKIHIVLTKYWHELERQIFTVASSSFFGLVLAIVIFIMISVSTIINDHYNFHFRRGEHRTRCRGNVAAIQPCQCENGNWPGEIVLCKYCPKTVIAWQQHAVEQPK